MAENLQRQRERDENAGKWIMDGMYEKMIKNVEVLMRVYIRQNDNE